MQPIIGLGLLQVRHVRREVDILEGLRDPAIVALVDYFESRLECVILTEYLAGGELFERIADTQYSLTEAKCKGFMRQVGVAYQRGHQEVSAGHRHQGLVLVA